MKKKKLMENIRIENKNKIKLFIKLLKKRKILKFLNRKKQK